MRNHGDNQATSCSDAEKRWSVITHPSRTGSPASPLNLMKVRPRYKFHRDFERLGCQALTANEPPKRIGDRS